MVFRLVCLASMLVGSSAFVAPSVRVGGIARVAASPAMQTNAADIDDIIEKLRGLSLLEASELVQRIEEFFEEAGKKEEEESGDEEGAAAEDSE
eukprot:scaffold249910_cov37-Tisochrysis_lutea.AAC.1